MKDYAQWLQDEGYGMTALQFYQMLEKVGFDGPAVHIWRSQYLRTGTCTFDAVDQNELYHLNDHWHARYSDGL